MISAADLSALAREWIDAEGHFSLLDRFLGDPVAPTSQRIFVAAARRRREAKAGLLPSLREHGEPVDAGRWQEVYLDPATGEPAARSADPYG